MKVAITGGAGFIGAALANELLAQGNKEILVMDNLTAGDWSRLDGDYEKVFIDISTAKPQELKSLLSDVKILFHLSAVKLHNEKNTFDDLVLNNVIGTQRILEAAGEAGVESIVFTSSLYVYGMPKTASILESELPLPSTVYGGSKLFGEELVSIAGKKFGFNFSIARLFFIYGEKQYSTGGYKSVIVNNFERIILGQPVVINGDGRQILDYLHVNDCVDALILLGKTPKNEIFNISSGVPLTIQDLSNSMLEIAGTTNSIFADRDWTHGTRRVGSNSKIKEFYNWAPKISLKDGLDRTWRSLK